jgi:hypothetical protein
MTRLLTEIPACGHEALTADGAPLVCGLAPGHDGPHEQRYRLRDGQIERTNWREDGKALWAPVRARS